MLVTDPGARLRWTVVDKNNMATDVICIKESMSRNLKEMIHPTE